MGKNLLKFKCLCHNVSEVEDLVFGLDLHLQHVLYICADKESYGDSAFVAQTCEKDQTLT